MNLGAAALPEDIILDILMRLCVKSLVRFRCVCKLWLSLINDSYFIRKHTDRVNLGNENEIAILCFNSAPSASHINKIKYSEIIEGVGDGNHQDDNLNNPTTELLIKEINIPGELKSGGFRVKSTCDGLILLFVDSLNSPLLWNPSIEEYKILSLSPLQQSCNFPSAYGIGYDPSIDDYKVLRAPSSVSSKHSESVEVLSLKSNSWKTIQDKFSYEISHENRATFLNGALHWLATCKVTRERVILQFNVREETFGELQLPNFKDKLSYPYECKLQVFGGNLCFCIRTQEGTLDVWVMKEYGVKESWTKLLTLRPLAAETIHLYCSMQNGILVLNSSTCEFLMYNRREETFRKISNIIDSMGSITSSIAYVKSLVSPLKYCNSS